MSGLVVTVKQGDLRGVETESAIDGSGSYISFKGIPYAAAPVGDLRFRDPQPPRSWVGVRNAFEEGSKSAQIDPFTKTTIGDDDCLYLNVATKSLTGSRPVMFWIHGGGFYFGNGGYDLYSPDYIVEADVVYVGINYRLGVLGFLNLDHELAPGNMGLKDQVAALKWVKENIAQFGGNPNNVTIFGQSAGGASVHYLLLSPLAKGLFHKAILQSGVALNPFATALETSSVAHRYVAALGKNTTDPGEIVEYLRTIPAHRLIEFQVALQTVEDGADVKVPFGPGVDEKSVEPFMPKPVRELAAEGFDVPIVIGYTSHEGCIFLKSLFFTDEVSEKFYERLWTNSETNVPRFLAAKAPSKVSEMAKEIKNFYFGDKQITKDVVDEFVQYYGDLHLGIGVHEVTEIQRGKKSPTYVYRFCYDSPNSIAKAVYQVAGKGATHTEELFYLFHSDLIPEETKIKPGSTEKTVQDRLVRLWTNFAKTGNPTPSIDDLIAVKWEPVTQTSNNYLKIDAELSAGLHPNEEMWKMWQRIHSMADGVSIRK